jgi:hypothetical protein
MHATSRDDSGADRLLYSHHKALDAVLDLGAVPERLFKVFYPIWRVRVKGRQRIPTDFEELEWYIERGLHEAGLNSVAGLAQFFGLETRFVRKLVSFLQGIGHIKGDEDRLTLTELGLESVQKRIRFQDQETSAILYFDGLGSRPLTREHYQIPVYDELPDATPFRAFYHFDHRWDEEAIQRLMEQSDRGKYNLPDEITKITPLDRKPAYLPAYIVERRSDSKTELPLFLVFSRIRDKRDAVLEEAVNVEQLALVPLREAKRLDLEQAVDSILSQYGLSHDDWYMHPSGSLGPQVMVDARVLARSCRGMRRDDEEGQNLAVGDVGKYFSAYDWCVWLTCDDAEVRQQAAIEQLLGWLQGVTATPTAEDLRQRLDVMRDRLNIEPISADILMDAAEQRGIARALERLDALVTGDEEL